MKQVFLSFLVIFCIASCNTEQLEYGQGGRNACQFVKEQAPELRDDIQDIEVIAEDSLLTTVGLTMESPRLAKAESDYYAGTITESQFEEVISDFAKMSNDIENSWRFGSVVNDSLHQLKKYEYMWRKVYTVRVTMKSGATKEPRVLMENDGVTPRCIEKDFEKELREYVDQMMDVINRKLYGI